METRRRKIDKSDFDRQLKRLVDWFRPRLATEQGDLIYRKLNHYSLDALTAAVEKLVESRKPTPAQFPTVEELRHLMWEYEQQPGTGTRKSFLQTKCSECQGEGLIWWMVDEGYMRVEYVGRCDSCQNWRKHETTILPIVNRSELKARGYEIFP